MGSKGHELSLPTRCVVRVLLIPPQICLFSGGEYIYQTGRIERNTQSPLQIRLCRHTCNISTHTHTHTHTYTHSPQSHVYLQITVTLHLRGKCSRFLPRCCDQGPNHDLAPGCTLTVGHDIESRTPAPDSGKERAPTTQHMCLKVCLK